MYIDKKKELLTAFLQLTCELEEMLEREEYEQLDEKLNERQRIIEAVNELDRQIGTEQARQATVHMESLLRMAAKKESEVYSKMVHHKNKLGEELQKINRSKRLNQSYQDTPYNTDGYFIDRTLRSR